MKRGTGGETIWFDEKLFIVEMAHNRHIDRVIGKNNFEIPTAKKKSLSHHKTGLCHGLSGHFFYLEIFTHFCGLKVQN